MRITRKIMNKDNTGGHWVLLGISFVVAIGEEELLS